MKSTQISTPHSSVKSSSTTIMESETKDSHYFPECRKDTNCNCGICIASFNATLDLMHKNSITRLSAARATQFPKSPISYSPSTTLSTPKSSSNCSASSSMSPPLNSTAKKREFAFGILLMRLIFGLGVVFGLEFGFSWVVSGFLKPQLSGEIVENLSEKSWGLKDLDERLVFLKKELDVLIDDEGISSCSPLNSTWKINQDGLLLNSRCTLYKSNSEELSIWGWPLQTVDLLTPGFSWFNGEIGYLIRKSNSSWIQQKWSASAFLKFRLRREIQKLKQEFWLLFSFTSQPAQ
ncbi:unnamed protein product [Withania somnifera]